NQTQAMLLLFDPASKAAYGGRPVKETVIDAATANAAKASRQRPMESGLPATMPRFRAPGVSAPLCAVYADTEKGSTKAVLTTGSRVGIPTPATGADAEKVDQVLLPPGSAVLAGTLPGDGQLSSVQQYSIITDQGRRFQLLSPDLVGKLGYETKDVA